MDTLEISYSKIMMYWSNTSLHVIIYLSRPFILKIWVAQSNENTSHDNVAFSLAIVIKMFCLIKFPMFLMPYFLYTNRVIVIFLLNEIATGQWSRYANLYTFRDLPSKLYFFSWDKNSLCSLYYCKYYFSFSQQMTMKLIG